MMQPKKKDMSKQLKDMSKDMSKQLKDMNPKEFTDWLIDWLNEQDDDTIRQVSQMIDLEIKRRRVN